MTKKERINEIVKILNKEYGTEVTHYLDFNNLLGTVFVFHLLPFSFS